MTCLEDMCGTPAELDVLLPAILQSSLRFAVTGDRAFKVEL
jgi:hypothetical protein